MSGMRPRDVATAYDKPKASRKFLSCYARGGCSFGGVKSTQYTLPPEGVSYFRITLFHPQRGLFSAEIIAPGVPRETRPSKWSAPTIKTMGNGAPLKNYPSSVGDVPLTMQFPWISPRRGISPRGIDAHFALLPSIVRGVY